MVAFVFADLITLPLLLIYRRYYGGALALRILAGFWLVMSVSGLAVEALFSALHAIPVSRPATLAPESLALNYTSVLNVLAVAGFLGLYLLHRHRSHRLSRAHGRDPVCGMQVEIANAPARRQHNGVTVHFCSDHCAERFDQQHAVAVGGD